jgi:hypothetical protein
MHRKHCPNLHLFTLLIALLLPVKPASADRCDCSSNGWISGCSATIRRDGDGVQITSSSPQCSRVDWHLGQSPQVSVFRGGKEWEFVPPQLSTSPISVESCRVCKDTLGDSAARAPNRNVDDSRSRAPSDCDAFLRKMQEISMGASIDNAERQMQKMTSLCGGDINACMLKIQECTL